MSGKRAKLLRKLVQETQAMPGNPFVKDLSEQHHKSLVVVPVNHEKRVRRQANKVRRSGWKPKKKKGQKQAKGLAPTLRQFNEAGEEVFPDWYNKSALPHAKVMAAKVTEMRKKKSQMNKIGRAAADPNKRKGL